MGACLLRGGQYFLWIGLAALGIADRAVRPDQVDGALHEETARMIERCHFLPSIHQQRKRKVVFRALSENLTKRPLLRNFLHPLNCEEPTLVTAIRLAMDERHRSGWFERDAEGAGLRLNWAGHGERLDEGVGIPGLSG